MGAFCDPKPMKLSPDQRDGEKTTLHCGMKACPLPRAEPIPTRRSRTGKPRLARCRWHLKTWSSDSIHDATCQIGNHLILIKIYYQLAKQSPLDFELNRYELPELPDRYASFKKQYNENWYQFRQRYRQQLDDLLLTPIPITLAS